MNLKSKITTSLATGSLLLGMAANAAFAQTSVEISGNGAFSSNLVSVEQSHELNVNQSNQAQVSNNISVNANTGNNDANFNTGGHTAILTGDATTSVSVSNNLNSNYLSFGQGGYDMNMQYDNTNHDPNNSNSYHDGNEKHDREHHEKLVYEYKNLSYKHHEMKDEHKDDHKDNDNHKKFADEHHKNDQHNKDEHKDDHKDELKHKEFENKKFLSATLHGDKEVPGPGDPDGYGNAALELKLHDGELCTHLTVGNISSSTAAHIHKAPYGQAGPIVVRLPNPSDGYEGGCVNVDHGLLMDIQNNPSEYYVNVHNTEYPDGAVRGQLKIE